MKDKTKRIKCFGCEHISFHFLPQVTSNSSFFFGGVEIQIRHLCKNVPQVFSRADDDPWEHLSVPEHLPSYLSH